MTNLIETAKEQIKKAVEDSINKAVNSSYLAFAHKINVSVEVPKDKLNGDFAVSIAMVLSKIYKMSPRAIAEIILANIRANDTYIEKVEIAGPGFINFYLSKSWYFESLLLIEKYGRDYGRVNIGKGEKVMVEFVSANPTGPMHMGNARGGALGDCLASVLSFAGYDVSREFYVNDTGNQIEKFGISLETRYLGFLEGEDKHPFPEDGYHGEDIQEHMKNFIAIYGDKFVNVDSETRRKVFVEYALSKNIEKLKADLKRYRIKFDVWFRESELYESGDVQETIDILKEKGVTYKKDDALWFEATRFGSEKDDVLVRANGVPTYLAADIAYHRNKFIKRGFDKAIDIWGADHHGHVARLKGAMTAVGCDSDKLEIIIMQLVRLMQGNEVVRMSKRTGKSITLADLLEDVGVDAARFFFNMRQAGTHLDFDLKLAAEQSNENPVYYVQYAHARICSILRVLKAEGISLKNINEINISLLTQKEELEVLKHLCSLPEEIKQAALAMEPSRLTRYLMDLASYFHSFYNACRVKGEDESLMQARLVLCDSVRIVMHNVLSLIGIEAPEKM